MISIILLFNHFDSSHMVLVVHCLNVRWLNIALWLVRVLTLLLLMLINNIVRVWVLLSA